MRSALEVFVGTPKTVALHGTRWFWLAWLLAGELWDDALQEELATGPFGSHATRERLDNLPIALVYRAGVHVNAGEFTAASALIEESDAIAAATGYAPLGYASAVLVAWRGDEANAIGALRLGGGQRDDARRGTGDR